MSYEKTPSAKHAQTAADIETHNAWMDDRGYRFCQPCYEITGIKRLTGWTPNWRYSAVDLAASELKSGVHTCPVCHDTLTVTTPGTIWDDPPDEFADRVAP